MTPDQDAIAVVFNKQQVRQRKFAHFLKTFGPEALPDGPALARMMGTFHKDFMPLNTMMERPG
jgi:hypothetical protein